MENGACLDLDWEVYYGHDVHLTPGPGVNGSKQTIPPELCIAPGIRDCCSLMCLFLWAACRWPPNPLLSPIHFPSRLPASSHSNCCSISTGLTNLHATPACADFCCVPATNTLSTAFFTCFPLFPRGSPSPTAELSHDEVIMPYLILQLMSDR